MSDDRITCELCGDHMFESNFGNHRCGPVPFNAETDVTDYDYTVHEIIEQISDDEVFECLTTSKTVGLDLGQFVTVSNGDDGSTFYVTSMRNDAELIDVLPAVIELAQKGNWCRASDLSATWQTMQELVKLNVAERRFDGHRPTDPACYRYRIKPRG